MALLSDYAARVALQQCIVQQSGICYICNDLKYPLILEHKDNNRSNNPEDGSNWGAACVSCNTKKGKLAKVSGKRNKKHSAKGESVCVSVCEISGGSEDMMKGGELLKSELYRPRVRAWIKDTINIEKEPEASRLRDGAAEKFGLSQMTISRWLDGMCSPEGDYEYFTNDKGRKAVRIKVKK